MQQQQQPRNAFQGMFRGLFTLKGFLKYGTIAIGVIVIAAVIYYNTQMRPHDLISMFPTDQTPVQGQLVRYDSDQHRSELTLTEEDMVEPIWQAMQGSQVRYMQHISSAAVPVGGYYYEVMLSTEEDAASGAYTYAFACNSSGETVIKAMTYRLVDEGPMMEVLGDLFTQYEDQVTLVS